MAWKKFLWGGVLSAVAHQNYATGAGANGVSLHFEADFADIFEVRGMKRKRTGEHSPAKRADDRVVLAYRGLDNVVRRTLIPLRAAGRLAHGRTAPVRPLAWPPAKRPPSVTIACERARAIARAGPLR